MKKLLNKNFIFGLIIGAIVFSVFSVLATITLISDNVFYSNEKSEMNVTNVKEAVDELYDKSFNGKNDIIDALSNKGFSVSNSSTYSDIKDEIEDLPINILKDEVGNYSYKLEGQEQINKFENKKIISVDTILYNGVRSANGVDYYNIYGCAWSGTSLALKGNAQGPMFDNNSGHTAIIIVKGNASYAQFGYGNKSGALPDYQNTGANRENFEVINNLNGYTMTILPKGKRFFFGSGGAGGTIYAIYSIVLND